MAHGEGPAPVSWASWHRVDPGPNEKPLDLWLVALLVAALLLVLSWSDPERAPVHTPAAPPMPEEAPEPAPRLEGAAPVTPDPLLCPRCRQEMVIVAWITDVEVVDRVLKHRRERGLVSPFESRAPPLE